MSAMCTASTADTIRASLVKLEFLKSPSLTVLSTVCAIIKLMEALTLCQTTHDTRIWMFIKYFEVHLSFLHNYTGTGPALFNNW